MTLDDLAPIDPNTADLDTLCLLPGIGPVLAQRIIAARPFETVEDLVRVRGIGSAALERWISLLSLPSASIQPLTSNLDLIEADGIPAEVRHVERKPVPAELSVEAESRKAEVPPAQALGNEPPSLPEATPDETIEHRPAAATHSYVGWLVAISGLLVLVLSLLLSLGILATLNGNQLQFASPAQISTLAMRIEGLETRAGSLGQDVDGLRARLSKLEAMGERMSVVEQTAEALRNDVDAVATEVVDVSAQVGTVEDGLLTVSEQLEDLETDVGTLQAQSVRFQTFLEGLQALMDSLVRSEGGQ